MLYNGFEKYINDKNEYRLIFKKKKLNKLIKTNNLLSSFLYNIDIINQLIELEISTKNKIINAMDMVNNRNDINEIVEYLIQSDQHVKHDETKQQVCFGCIYLKRCITNIY